METQDELGFSDRFKVFFIAFTLVITFVVLSWPELVSELASFGSIDSSLLGWILTVNLILLSLYSLKKREMMMSFGCLSSWYDFHFYLAVFTFLVMFFHAGTVFGHGLSRGIVWLLLFILLNGFYGYLMHLIVPKVVLRRNSKWYEPDRLQEKRDDILTKMDLLATDKGEVVKNAVQFCRYKQTLRLFSLLFSFLLSGDPLSHYLSSFVKRGKKVPAEDREVFETILKRYEELIKIDEQLFFVTVMNGWVRYHVAGVFVLIILMCAHIFSFFYF